MSLHQARKSGGTEAVQQMQEGMKPWMEWSARCGDKLVDMGSPLMGGLSLGADGSTTPSSHDVTGYSILQAESMEEAKGLLQGHPHLGWNADCQIEVHECQPLPGTM